MPTSPAKLKTAASARAVPGLRQRVDTAVAMAFGASVAPEMTVTPITRMRMTMSAGWAPIEAKNTPSVRSMHIPIYALVSMMAICFANRNSISV